MERSEFSELLYKALMDSGFKYHGKLNITDEDFNSFKDLSPKQMAVVYAEKYNIEDKNKIFQILKEIYSLNTKKIFYYSLSKNLKQRILSEYYYFIFHNCVPSLLTITGKMKSLMYLWVPDRSPVFSDAELIYSIFKNSSSYLLTQQQMEFAEANYKLDWKVLFDLYNQSFPVEKENFNQIKFSFYRHLITYKHKMYLREYNKAPKRITYSTEIKRFPPLAPEPTADQTPPPETKNGEPSDKPDNSPGILFLLEKRMKMYSRIIKNQKAHIKQLEKYITGE